MSYLLKKVSIDRKTGKSTLISETVMEGDYRNGGDDLLVKFLAEKILKDFQEEQRKECLKQSTQQ